MKHRYLVLCIVMLLVTIFSLRAQNGTLTINQNPIVTLTSPVNSVFSAPATISLSAAASDPDGTIKKVIFYKNDDIIAVDSVAPYTASTSALLAGNYYLKARAYDNVGASTSFTRQIAVVNGATTNQPPTIGFLLPTTSVFAPPATVKVEVSANDTDGKVKKVEFYQNDALIATDSVVPYSVTLTSLPIGIYKIKAKATDDKGYSASITREMKVETPVAPNVPPTVSMTLPSVSTMSAPANVDLAANANDADGKVVYVAFYKNDDLIRVDSVAPYTASIAALPEGNYYLKAKAVDNKGATMTMSRYFSVVKPQVLNIPPSIKLEVSSSNSFQTPTNLSLLADAKDVDGTIKKVEFSYSTVGLFATDSIAPYTASIAGLTAGTYQISAKATDNKGATATTILTVTIGSPTTGNQAPTVKLEVKQTNTVLPATLSLKADAKDIDGTVAKVFFYRNDIQIGADSIAPYEMTLPNVAAGTYVFKAKAIDNKGAFSVTAVQTTIGSVVSQNQLPVVKFTSPTSTLIQAPATLITLSADASDADGTVKRVIFYNGDNVLAVDSIAPYTFGWANVAIGNYIIKAKAVDNIGASTTTSRYISVTAAIVPNVPPSIAFLQPTTSSFLAPATFDFVADAKDSDGKIVVVQFYLGDKLIANDSVAPYKTSLTNLTAGQYQIKAKATDNKGAYATVIRSITVSVPQPINQYPNVSITNPTTTLQLAPATMTVTATAKDLDGFVTRVVFFLNDNIVGTDSVAPYSAVFPTLQVGQYNIRARAFDNKGYSSTTTRSIYVVTSLTAPQNLPPTIYVLTPKPLEVFKAPAMVSIACDAKDPDGKVKKVEFYQNNILIGTDTTALYEQKIVGLVAGTYTFKIKATDDKGASATTTFTITVGAATPGFLAINTISATVFPNPFQGELSLNIKDLVGKTAQVTLLDMSGRVVLQTQNDVEDNGLNTTLNTETLDSGIYILQVQTPTETIVQKLIKH